MPPGDPGSLGSTVPGGGFPPNPLWATAGGLVWNKIQEIVDIISLYTPRVMVIVSDSNHRVRLFRTF